MLPSGAWRRRSDCATSLISFRLLRLRLHAAKHPTEAILAFHIMHGKISPVPPPSQLKTLDDLLAQAAHYAEFCMRNSGKMPPTLFLIGTDGPMLFIPENLAGDGDKDAFATTARLMCIAHVATACVMALEAWMKVAKPDEKLDMTEMPSESFDRQEAIVLMGEDRAGQKQKFLPIIRSGNGKFFGLNESETPVMDSMTGRFAQILSPKVPDEQAQILAKTVLQVKGVKTVGIGNAPRKSRSRR